MEPFLGEIRLFAGYPPKGWAPCNGQQMAISTNVALYSLLGTQFGGDGRTYFNLPDLQGRVALSMNSTYRQGTTGGTQTVALSSAEMPMHTHAVQASSATGDQYQLSGNYWAGANTYAAPSSPPDCALHPSAIATTGAGAPHNNMQPYLAVQFCIATTGLFPPRQ